MKSIINLLFLSILLVSCSKNAPKPGVYQMTFTGTYEMTGETSLETGIATISETTKDYFIIGNSKIHKCGKKIKGKLVTLLPNLPLIEIEGTWEKKKGKYYLTGTYRATYITVLYINGTFEIKST
jgi:hypothetical protein